MKTAVQLILAVMFSTFIIFLGVALFLSFIDSLSEDFIQISDDCREAGGILVNAVCIEESVIIHLPRN